MNLRPLTDDVLLARLDALVAGERSCAADVVEHLAEVDRRELAIDRGYGTLFEYCRKKLGYSESASVLRIRAARAANQFPRVLDELRSGSIHLDAIMRLYPHLNSGNCERVLTRASGASKNEILALVAQIAPAAPPVERDGRCESRGALEYDHIVPWALGGRSDLANIRLLCRPHNQRLARRRFGPRRRP